jgi:hypothetical protein
MAEALLPLPRKRSQHLSEETPQMYAACEQCGDAAEDA